MRDLSWLGILRLGLVQMALGSIVVLTTATMNRVMQVELALPAVLPGLLTSLYYATQISRPKFGHAADAGGRRTAWIIGGMAVLAAGALIVAWSIGVMQTALYSGLALAVFGYLFIGFGIGSAGTNLLALLAARVSNERKAAAGSAVWIMMIAGLVVTAIAAGAALDPYSHDRLFTVTAAVGAVALTLTILGVWGQERGARAPVATARRPFREALREVWDDPVARPFAIFVFAAMLAYNAQDLILEPFGGHVFGMSVAESTQLSAKQHGGALTGMIVVLLAGTFLRRWVTVPVQVWVVGGCVASGLALVGMGVGGQVSPDWPISANVFLLGLANGIFAVAAIGAMMTLATEGTAAREGTRMGVFGAAQAIAFGVGSFLGTVAVDVARTLLPDLASAYGSVFIAEGGLFLIAAALAARLTLAQVAPPLPVPGE
ncbi:MAG: BCD family MFS transporter [Pseudomonadota bacterium]